MQQKTFRSKDMRRARTFAAALLVTGLWLSGLPPTHADETCMSPYRAKITGQEAVADIGDPSKVPLPVDSTISADDRLLWVNTFMDGTTRAFDISDPFHPTPVYEKRIGSQVNMVSQS